MAVRLTNGLYAGPITRGSNLGHKNIGNWSLSSDTPAGSEPVTNISQLGLDLSIDAMNRIVEYFYAPNPGPADDASLFCTRLLNDTGYPLLFCIGEFEDGSSHPYSCRVFNSTDYVRMTGYTITSIHSSYERTSSINLPEYTLLMPGQYTRRIESYVDYGVGFDDTSGARLGFLYLGGIIAQATVV